MSRLKDFINLAPCSPGVYEMLNNKNEIIYIGKANNLKNRLQNYACNGRLSKRIKIMVQQIESIRFNLTSCSREALLLENNLIKKHKPNFNVLLKDDRSYPYILLTEHDFPRLELQNSLAMHKNNKLQSVHLFGPFVSGGKQIIDLIQKHFKLRSCSDNTLNSRKRPCLEYFINNCSAPCVGHIDKHAYGLNIGRALEALSGKTKKIISHLTKNMEECSKNCNYEEAASLRDKIVFLKQLGQQQLICLKEPQNLDIFLIQKQQGQVMVMAFLYRQGVCYGGESKFLEASEEKLNKILEQVLLKHYYNNIKSLQPTVGHVICNILPYNYKILNSYIPIFNYFKQKNNNYQQLIKHLIPTVNLNLQNHCLNLIQTQELLQMVAKQLKILHPIHSIECYDNSHWQGFNPYGAKIVWQRGKFNKNMYRLYSFGQNLNNDCFLLEEVFKRRLRDNFEEVGLFLIDGGVAQVNRVGEVMDFLGLGHLKHRVVGISKGPNRNAKEENLWLYNSNLDIFYCAPQPKKHCKVLHFLQSLRDEAHNFALRAQGRASRKVLLSSTLDSLRGIGPKTKELINLHFNSLEKLKNAPPSEVEKILGKSKTKLILKHLSIG